jgi:hypothetical protein
MKGNEILCNSQSKLEKEEQKGWRRKSTMNKKVTSKVDVHKYLNCE